MAHPFLGLFFWGGTFLGRLLGTLYRRTCPRSARPGAFLVRAWKRGSENSWRLGGSPVENEGMSTPFLRGPDFQKERLVFQSHHFFTLISGMMKHATNLCSTTFSENHKKLNGQEMACCLLCVLNSFWVCA